MTFLYTADQVRELDRIAIEEEGIPGLILMKRAGQACVDAMLERWPEPGSVSVLCGSGNNAGDGFIIAGLLADKGISAKVGLVGREPVEGTDAAGALDFCRKSDVAFVDPKEAVADSNLVVDALLGTGITGGVRDNYAQVIAAINARDCPVVAVDLPSGLSADTGAQPGTCVHADLTVTFIGRKLGLMTCDGPEYCGEISFSDLDVPASIYKKLAPAADVLEYESLARLLAPRHRNAHKMSHGHVLIVGGSEGMGGAIAMAAEAALHTGAGMVTAATRPENVPAIIARRPEVMARGVNSAQDLKPLLDRATVVVIGPGLGRSDWSREMFGEACQAEIPLVLDADALNLLAENPEKSDRWVLTPHPGEAGRLLSETERVQSDRLDAVKSLQNRYGGVVLLKGAGTLVADDAVSLCPYGNPGMSVAGMGDLLAGTIGGLMAQGLNQGEAARLGAVAHSLAADRVVAAQGERGLLATELLPEIRRLINR